MEIWELVDSDGVPSGVLYERGSKAEIPVGLYFRVVEIWVKIGEKLLVTRRHPSKWMGLKWEVTGGGVVANEIPLVSAVRELFEETGIVAEKEKLRLLGRMNFGQAMVYSYNLILQHLPEFEFDENEVVDYRLVTKEEFIRMKASFNPGTVARFERYCDEIFK